MKRYERTRALVEGDPTLASEIVSDIEHVAAQRSIGISVLDEPREELVMVKVRETAQNNLFYLGEALMTSCRVRVGQAVGLGMLLGSNRNRALELAIVDAAFSGPDAAEYTQRWGGRIAEEARRVRQREAAEQALCESTRVDFSTMDEQVGERVKTAEEQADATAETEVRAEAEATAQAEALAQAKAEMGSGSEAEGGSR